ncbi:MAG: ATP-binding protein [Thermotaleaceae bacterium]
MSQNTIEELFAGRTRNSIGRMKSPKQALSFEQLKIFYEENEFHLNEHFANNLELLTDEGKYNYVAYLLADVNGTSIKVAKYSGDDRYELIENNEYGYCSLIKAAKRVLDKLEVENRTLAKITSKEREEKNLVDKIALREAVINAIVHNDYSNEIPPKVEIFSDRIEITSSGGLVQGMTEEEFFSGYSAPRNKELMRVFKDIHLVEQLGSGMIRILKKYDRSIFTITPNFIRVAFPFSNVIEFASEIENGGLNGGLKSLFDIIKNNPGIKTKEASDLLDNRSISTIEKQMRVLSNKGLIERRGSKKTGGYYVVE